jgi:hypothetical protein
VSAGPPTPPPAAPPERPRTVQANTSSHLDQEERDILAGWQRQLTLSRRLELGRQWMAFMAAWTLDAATELSS